MAKQLSINITKNNQLAINVTKGFTKTTVISNDANPIVRGEGAYEDATFTFEDLTPGGDGRRHYAVFFESDNTDRVKVVEDDEKGIRGSVRQQPGSHYEAFIGTPNTRAQNPMFRLSSFPNMGLQLGNGYEEVDAFFIRYGKDQAGLWVGSSNLSSTVASDALILGGRNGMVTKPMYINGGSTIFALGTELVDYDFGDWTGPAFGSNLVTNGTFTTDTDWTKGTGWTISGGTASHIASAESNLSQNITVTPDRMYEINVTVSGMTAGWLEPGISTLKGERIYQDGTYQYHLYNSAFTGSTSLIFKGSAKFAGSIDSVTVVEFTNWSYQDDIRNAWKHLPGSVTALTRTGITTVANQSYLVGLTIGSTIADATLSGSVSVTLGGVAIGTYNTKGVQYGIVEVSGVSSDLVFTPTSDFNGYIQNASVRLISGSTLKVYGDTTTNTFNSYLNNSSTSPQVTIEQDGSAGDASLRWLLTGTRAYSMGIDNSVTNDPLKISSSSGGLGTNDIWSLTNLGLNTLTQLGITEGSNAAMGVSTLVGGTVTVSNTRVTANSRIFLTTQTVGGVLGVQYISAMSANTSFTITSSSVADTSTVAWLIVEPS